ncbi:hypothetical protein T4D_5776 [Trichinella pseudospiralis]|uniref:Uncharacterized protein n=1 Tax=Trichinella pseudospiralis TaxID=6337 RepID=A0A0V1FX53_TRIPS|nr:hypothetical protein T4D_5776 [Trichinella pseudospiralis]
MRNEKNFGRIICSPTLGQMLFKLLILKSKIEEEEEEEEGICCNLSNKQAGESAAAAVAMQYSILQLSKVAVNLLKSDYCRSWQLVVNLSRKTLGRFAGYFLHTNEMKTQKNVPARAQSTFYTFERFLQIQLSSSLS